MTESHVWATEEFLLTLVALLGYDVTADPFSYDSFIYGVALEGAGSTTRSAIRTPTGRTRSPRGYDDPAPRVRSGSLQPLRALPTPTVAAAGTRAPASLLIERLPILQQMRSMKLARPEEADLLIAALSVSAGRATSQRCRGRGYGELLRALDDGAWERRQGTAALRRSWCTRSIRTRRLRRRTRPGDDGDRADAGALRTQHRRRRAYGRCAGTIRRSRTTEWDAPILFILIDGLHDYAGTFARLCAFRAWIVPGGYVAFHDYADYWPGVRTFVNELLTRGEFRGFKGREA